MIRLPTPREVPDRWPYLRAQVDGVDCSPLVFRMPRTPDVFTRYAEALDAFRDAEPEAQTTAAEALAQAAAEALSRVWAHPEWELEAEGEGLLDELWEAGITESTAIRIVGELIAQRTQRVITEAEVAKRSSFFGERESSKP